jgi:uroporphyrin-III C-methyltransferase
MARPDARIEFAGKRGGKPSPKQRDITLSLIAHARSGCRVLRLKGGDPFVFGRGAEEALALVAAGIPFRIVPGISAGLGALAYAGIPLTHREINHTVTFLTGHDSSGEMPERIDWESVAAGSPVIVMYMAMKHWPNICRRLLQAGRAMDEPVAFIADGTCAAQRVLETTLGRSDADLACSSLEPPAIIVVGDVVKLRAGLDWLGAFTGKVLNASPLGADPERDAG